MMQLKILLGEKNQRLEDTKLRIAGMLSYSLATMLEISSLLDKFLFHFWKALILHIFT